MSKRKKRLEISLHHCALSVTDLDRSIEFYDRVLGFKVDTKSKTDDGVLNIVHLRNGSDYLELFAHRDWSGLPEHAKSNETDIPVVGTKHMAFSTGNPDKFHRHLQNEGVDGLTEIYNNNQHYKYFFFNDPDGITIEIVTRISPVMPFI